MKKLAGLALILAGCTSPTYTLDEVADKMYQKGSTIVSKEYSQELSDAYTQLIQKNDTIEARFTRFGINFQLAKQHSPRRIEYAKLCLEDAKKYIEFSPEDPTGYVFHGMALLSISYRNRDEAINYLREGLMLIDQGKELRLFNHKEILKLFWSLKKKPKRQKPRLRAYG